MVSCKCLGMLQLLPIRSLVSPIELLVWRDVLQRCKWMYLLYHTGKLVPVHIMAFGGAASSSKVSQQVAAAPSSEALSLSLNCMLGQMCCRGATGGMCCAIPASWCLSTGLARRATKTSRPTMNATWPLVRYGQMSFVRPLLFAGQTWLGIIQTLWIQGLPILRSAWLDQAQCCQHVSNVQHLLATHIIASTFIAP